MRTVRSVSRLRGGDVCFPGVVIPGVGCFQGGVLPGPGGVPAQVLPPHPPPPWTDRQV